MAVAWTSTFPAFLGGATRLTDLRTTWDNNLFERNSTTGAIKATLPVLANAGIQTDGTNTLKTKVIDIGDWDMVATVSVAIAHGLTITSIRGIEVIIRNDDGIRILPINAMESPVTSTMIEGYVSVIGTTLVNLTRITGGVFDGTGYDSTSFNRGWITITYVV
jgi:hypothetical protein